MEEDGLEAEDGEDGVGGVEVNVGEHVRHDVVDHVLEARYPVHEQGYTLRGYAWKKRKQTLEKITQK